MLLVNESFGEDVRIRSNQGHQTTDSRTVRYGDEKAYGQKNGDVGREKSHIRRVQIKNAR